MHATPVRAIQRSYSFDAQSTKSPSIDITSLLDIDEKMLIGDRSREYCLPIANSKHPDLKGITAETLCDVMDEKYSSVIKEYLIVDCRYPYEYNGGHIRGARNLYKKSQVIQEFLKNPKVGKRQIIIFHCEFSSKRGPALCRFLRNKDRELNECCYPKLYYPELYLLVGGYREFYERKMEYCEPQSYRKMDDPEFSKELKIFAKSSKSWTEGTDHKERHRTGLRY